MKLYTVVVTLDNGGNDMAPREVFNYEKLEQANAKIASLYHLQMSNITSREGIIDESFLHTEPRLHSALIFFRENKSESLDAIWDCRMFENKTK